MRNEYAALAGSYERRWGRYLDASLGLLRPALTSRPPRRMLDLGCGSGALRVRLRRWGVEVEHYVGADLSPEMLAAAEPRPADGWVAADGRELPFAAGSFDTVVCASALHYFADPAAVLGEARRVLTPRGRLLLVDWSRGSAGMRLLELWLRLTRRPLRRIYGADEAAALALAAGFSVVGASLGSAPPRWRLFVLEAEAR